eukprot:CAMPEP_0180173190 /NCGR_PEP_ID=MMETSP0986-20121125/35443_1 /TAXON_ID=697907 /ORGANISM="non described non described, Strain CCMP2293" /LENGTH=191 /DNA_ID=CAMNT_0022125361 /DNA_START=118 /DNA_END=689 /DNA_ORIENTATION=-
MGGAMSAMVNSMSVLVKFGRDLPNIVKDDQPAPASPGDILRAKSTGKDQLASPQMARSGSKKVLLRAGSTKDQRAFEGEFLERQARKKKKTRIGDDNADDDWGGTQNKDYVMPENVKKKLLGRAKSSSWCSVCNKQMPAYCICKTKRVVERSAPDLLLETPPTTPKEKKENEKWETMSRSPSSAGGLRRAS